MKAETILHKQVHDKNTLQIVYINRARLTACKVGAFLRGILQLSKIRLPPFLRSHLISLPMGVFKKDYRVYIYLAIFIYIYILMPGARSISTFIL